MGQTDELRAFGREYMLQYVGTFYSWGREDPDGFDCSGLASELLQMLGVLPRKARLTADGIFRMLQAGGKRPPLAFGQPPLAIPLLTLLFYGEPKITHVEIAMGHGLALGASGGGSKTLTKEDAIRDNAFVKVRPIMANGYAIDPLAT